MITCNSFEGYYILDILQGTLSEPNKSSGTMLPVCDLDGGIPEGCLCVKAEENVETAELDMQLKTGKLDFEKLNEKLGQVFIFE